jgi:hypothetical protein
MQVEIAAERRVRNREKARMTLPSPEHLKRIMRDAPSLEDVINWIIRRAAPLCLSEIRSGHIRGAIRQGPRGKEYVLTCVYRQLKRGRSGDEVRPGWRVN